MRPPFKVGFQHISSRSLLAVSVVRFLPLPEPAIGALDVACRDSTKFGVSADEGWDYGNDLRRTVPGCGRSKPSSRCWKEFVSLSKQVDTSMRTGRMIFTVLGAVAELERSLIAERVRAGLRNARAKGL